MAWFYSKFRSNSEIRVSENNTSISTYYMRNSNFISKKNNLSKVAAKKKKKKIYSLLHKFMLCQVKDII